MSMKVRVAGAPGYADFGGEAVPGMHRFRIASGQPLLTVVLDEQQEPHVIRSEFVFDVNEEESQR